MKTVNGRERMQALIRDRMAALHHEETKRSMQAIVGLFALALAMWIAIIFGCSVAQAAPPTNAGIPGGPGSGYHFDERIRVPAWPPALGPLPPAFALPSPLLPWPGILPRPKPPREITPLPIEAITNKPADAAPKSTGPVSGQSIVRTTQTASVGAVSFAADGSAPPALPNAAAASVDAEPVKQSKPSSPAASRRRQFAFLASLQRDADDAVTDWRLLDHSLPTVAADD
jgi:hypothetical protein